MKCATAPSGCRGEQWKIEQSKERNMLIKESEQ